MRVGRRSRKWRSGRRKGVEEAVFLGLELSFGGWNRGMSGKIGENCPRIWFCQCGLCMFVWSAMLQRWRLVKVEESEEDSWRLEQENKKHRSYFQENTILG